MMGSIKVESTSDKAKELGAVRIQRLIDLAGAGIAVLADETDRKDADVSDAIERDVEAVAKKALDGLDEISGSHFEYLVHLFAFAASIASTAVVEYELMEMRMDMEGGAE